MSTLAEGVQSELLSSTGGVVYDQVTVAAGGGIIEFVLPEDFHTCLIKIGVQGDYKDPTGGGYAMHIRNVEMFEIFTTEGEALRVQGGNGLDPFWYSHWVQKTLDRSYRVGGDTVDEELMVMYDIPLSLGTFRWFNQWGEFFGLPMDIADRLRVDFGADADVGIESRQATVQAFGMRKPKPKAFRTTIPDAYTAAVGQSHWTELPPDTRLQGVWTFHTTHWNEDTAAIDLGIDEQRLAYGRTSFYKRVKLCTMQQRAGQSYNDDPALYFDVPPDHYTYWPLDPCEMGAGEPNPGNLIVESVGGIAEAVRVYPIVWRLV